MIRTVIVDDEYIARKGLRETIAWEKYDMEIVGEADSGRRALELVKHGQVDLMLVDITMPKMTGLELIRELRKEAPEVLSVVVTCHVGFEYARDAIREGAIDYLVKTELAEEEGAEENLKRISRKVHRLLERRRGEGRMTQESEELVLKGLCEEIWFVDRGELELLLESIRALSAVSSAFRRQVNEVLKEQQALYRIPAGRVSMGIPDEIYTADMLAGCVEQMANDIYTYFAGTGYREEILLSVLQAVNYMMRHLGEVGNQTDLCERFAISRSYFSRTFRDILGVNFLDYVQYARIQEAKKLLRERSVKTDEVAAAVGLDNVKYFNKVFSRAVGMSPAAYRRQAWNRSDQEEDGDEG